MVNLYDAIRKDMFAYFCKHNGHIINENFAIPRKLKIIKKSQKHKTHDFHSSDKANAAPSVVQLNHLVTERDHKEGKLAVERETVEHGSY